MAYNVFGNPITDETLKGMPEYADKQIGRLARAYVALNVKNAAEKGFNARTHVEKLKEQYGDGVSTLCLVYNATGHTIRYVYKKDWYGHIGKAPYPPLIANGQWGAFLHVKTAGESSGSNAAVVYRGLNIVNEECDWMLSWSNPWDRTKSDNTVYTEVRKAGHFDTAWDEIYKNLDNVQENIKHASNGCVSIMSTGSGTSPIVEAILTLDLPVEMVNNVFGNPITDETLKGMPEYDGKEITRLDRARVAFNMKYVGEKSLDARTYVENLKREYGLGISTLCLVYNATGYMIKFHARNDWHGHIGKAPYPDVILNGQWGAFLHVQTAGESSGSNAAVVYRGLNNVSDECDWMLSWRNRTGTDTTVSINDSFLIY
ncbi:hypothetical protein C1H46_033821 [Malus baccata]|uniref:23 kDa jasmonate-induced protein-like n=1 Tax=Malus baccata TaxID=106549 RepID=A0A540L302_MALBA|nr:hypothetical protein C1H46_033821 [Malus baccata]